MPTYIYLKEQREYIQNQIDKIRDSVEDRQSRIAWQTVSEVSGRKSPVTVKLKHEYNYGNNISKIYSETLQKLNMNQSQELLVNNKTSN